MPQDVDVPSSNAPVMAENIGARLAGRLHLAIRVCGLTSREISVFQVRKPNSRHLTHVRNLDTLPSAGFSASQCLS
jgi:hypothetical protein